MCRRGGLYKQFQRGHLYKTFLHLRRDHLMLINLVRHKLISIVLRLFLHLLIHMLLSRLKVRLKNKLYHLSIFINHPLIYVQIGLTILLFFLVVYKSLLFLFVLILLCHLSYINLGTLWIRERHYLSLLL